MGAIQDALSLVRDVATIAEKLENLDLKKALLAAETEMLEVKRDLLRKDDEIVELRASLVYKRNLRFQAGVWWAQEEGEWRPFCPACWEGTQRSIHLIRPQQQIGDLLSCPVCKQHFTGRRSPPDTGE